MSKEDMWFLHGMWSGGLMVTLVITIGMVLLT